MGFAVTFPLGLFEGACRCWQYQTKQPAIDATDVPGRRPAHLVRHLKRPSLPRAGHASLRFPLGMEPQEDCVVVGAALRWGKEVATLSPIEEDTHWVQWLAAALGKDHVDSDY